MKRHTLAVAFGVMALTVGCDPSAQGNATNVPSAVATASATPAQRSPSTEPTAPSAPPVSTPITPSDPGAAAFGTTTCAAAAALELAIGNDAGALGPEAKAFTEALGAHDPARTLATVGPIRAHLVEARSIVNGRTVWEPGESAMTLLDQFLRAVEANVAMIEEDARSGIAPADPQAAFIGEAALIYFDWLAQLRAVFPLVPGDPGC